MNKVIIWNKENIQDNNYITIILLIMFNIHKIIECIYYNDLISVYKMVIYYFTYSLLEYIISKLFKKEKIDNYFLVNTLIISFLIPSNVPIHIFLLGAILGIIIRNLSKNKLSSSIIFTLFTYIYLFTVDNVSISIYTGIFEIIYLILCLISYILLARKKLVKRYLPIMLILMYLIINKENIDNNLFIIIFMASDTRYNSLTKRGEIISIILLCTIYYVFNVLLKINYDLLLSIFISEIAAIIINKKRL